MCLDCLICSKNEKMGLFLGKKLDIKNVPHMSLTPFILTPANQ
jgi:hypothetical protein